MNMYTKWSILCLTLTLNLIADEEALPPSSAELPSLDLISKAEAPTAQKNKDSNQAVASKSQDIILQVKPGSKIVIQGQGKVVQTQNSSDSSPPPKEMTQPISRKSQTNGSQQPGWGGHRSTRYRHGWSLNGEFLWWKVAQEGLEYVLAHGPTITPAQQALDSQAFGKYESAKFDWNPGVRVGVGYTFKQRNWQLFGEYTHYHSSGKNSERKPADDKFIFPTYTIEVGTPPLPTAVATSHIKVTYNASDLLLTRNFVPVDYLFLQLGVGATAAWISEDWAFAYFGPEDLIYLEYNQDWNFKGGGIRIKFDNSWCLGKGFSIFNKISSAILLGSFHNTLSANNPNGSINPGTTNPVIDSSYNNGIFVPTTFFALGLDWSREFSRAALSIGVAGEVTTWYNLHQVYKTTFHSDEIFADKKDLRNVANVNFYGASFKIGLQF